ncbi:hypothetical protein AXF22_03590 [Prevotella scopos JCM 17725]|nr:hypothetical protein AXF22_03590 [Prevotella scopos JCM 17725]
MCGETHNLEVPGSSPGWSTNRFQKDVKQYVILAFKTRIIAVRSRFYSDFLFFIHEKAESKEARWQTRMYRNRHILLYQIFTKLIDNHMIILITTDLKHYYTTTIYKKSLYN